MHSIEQIFLCTNAVKNLEEGFDVELSKTCTTKRNARSELHSTEWLMWVLVEMSM